LETFEEDFYVPDTRRFVNGDGRCLLEAGLLSLAIGCRVSGRVLVACYELRVAASAKGIAHGVKIDNSEIIEKSNAMPYAPCALPL